MTSTVANHAFTVDHTQARELSRLASAMPYAGSLPSLTGAVPSAGPQPIDPARLVVWLDKLRERLVETAGREQAMRTELIELREDRRSVRRLLGLPLTALTDADPTAIY